MDCSAPPAKAGNYIMYSKLKGGGIVTRVVIAVNNHNYSPFLCALHLPLLSPVNSLPLLLLACPTINTWWKTQSRQDPSVFLTFLWMTHRSSENLALSAENELGGVSANGGGCRTKWTWESGKGEQSRRDEGWEGTIIRGGSKMGKYKLRLAMKSEEREQRRGGEADWQITFQPTI